MALVWELTKETINLPLGCLQGEEFVLDVVDALCAALAIVHLDQILPRQGHLLSGRILSSSYIINTGVPM